MYTDKCAGMYTDIHTHILPGVDDGAEDFDECFEMLNQAYANGIRHIYLTPHAGSRNESFDPNIIRDVFAKVCGRVAETMKDLRLDLGSENYYSQGTVGALREGRAFCLGSSRYTLIEFLPSAEYKSILGGLRSALEGGFLPILVHAERCECLYKKIERVDEIVDHGAYVQINANSFCGDRFNSLTRWCLKLFDEELVHFLASDCHDTKYRKPNIHEAADKLMKRNPALAKRILFENPEHIRNNTYIY